jgi:hypothetical protein
MHMANAKNSPPREPIRLALVPRADLPEADATAQAAAVTWRLVAAQLTPVIGARGLEVLFGRALHMTSAAFPWLAVSTDRGGSDGPLPTVALCLARQDPATAAEASYKLLLTFTELLTTLIGESLTRRLLAPVWANPSLPSAQELAL